MASDLKNHLDILRKDIVGSHYIYLIFNSSGKVLEILNPGGPMLEHTYRELSRAESLGQYYNLPDLISEKQSGGVLPKKNFEHHPYKAELFTTLPQTAILTRKLDSNLFLGRITLFRLMPDVYGTNLNSFIFADLREDRLLGFNDIFYNHFKEKYPVPESILSLPLSNLFSPSPLEFQQMCLPDFNPGSEGPSSVIYQKNFGNQDLGRLEEMVLVSRVERNDKGLLWENNMSAQVYMTFLKEINTKESDFVISLEMEITKGLGPYFVLGDRYFSEEKLPDNYGYFAGPDPFTPRLVFKKHGLKVVTAQQELPGSTSQTIHFCKIGRSLMVFAGNARQIAWYDNDFYFSENAFLSLGLRQGYACILKSISIKTGRSLGDEAPTRQIVRFHGRRERYHTLDRFYNYVLGLSPFENVGIYFLNDVTEMQDRIILLDKKYKKQVKKEAHLQALLNRYEGQEEFIGSGREVSIIKETSYTIAQSDATVLIEGPTGSGKEVLVKYIHQNSPRKNEPFIKVDCATIPRELIESHLFGHEKGAFTGAVSQSIGMFEKANRGTLFLDEVSNLSPETQAKLLQFFNDFTISRIGRPTPIKLDVRCIIASNASIEDKVRAGTFREDLYYRINVVYLKMPTLKERKEDIPELCTHFLNQFNAESRKKIKGMTPEAFKKIEAYEWPGNIRELKNLIHRAVIFCRGEFITPDLIIFPLERAVPVPARDKGEHAPFCLSKTDKEYIRELFRRHNGKITAIAEDLGVARGTVYNYLKRTGIDIDDFRKGFESKGII